MPSYRLVKYCRRRRRRLHTTSMVSNSNLFPLDASFQITNRRLASRYPERSGRCGYVCAVEVPKPKRTVSHIYTVDWMKVVLRKYLCISLLVKCVRPVPVAPLGEEYTLIYRHVVARENKICAHAVPRFYSNCMCAYQQRKQFGISPKSAQR